MATPADSLASKIALKAAPLAQSVKDSWIASLSNGLKRWAARSLWPELVGAIPYGCKIGVNLVADEFGTMNINDLIAFLDQHANLNEQKAGAIYNHFLRKP